MTQPTFQNGLVPPSARGATTVSIHFQTPIRQRSHRKIDQHHSRSRVEGTSHWRFARAFTWTEAGDIADASEIIHTNRFRPGLERDLMKRRRQWRALPSRCDIPRAEVAHDQTSRGFAQIRRLANLQTRGRWLAGIVKYRLAMQPDQLGRGIAAP
jgi:hypothetical protein